MLWLVIALAAQIILGTSAVFDKFLLKRKFFDPFVYTFWLGIFGAFVIFFLPFGLKVVSLSLIGVSFLTGAIFIISMFFLYLSLDKGEASKTLPFIGAFSPIFTLLLGYFLITSNFDLVDALGFLLLIAGGLVFFLIEHKEIRTKLIFYAVLSALFLGFSNVLTKFVFERTNFITGFFWIKIGGVIFVLLLLALPNLRENIFHSHRKSSISHKYLYFGNRVYAGLGSILIYGAINLAHPALVESTQSFKYAVIFLASWILLKEHFKGKVLAGKVVATVLIILGLTWLGMANYFVESVNMDRDIIWGITFSNKASEGFGVDWRKNYEAILTDLHPKRVRLVAYWEDIEKNQGSFDFSDLDWQINKSLENNAQVVLALGMKAPRWPECHIPEWARNINTEERENALRGYIFKVIERYKENSSVVMWQVENEPYLDFGECPQRGENFLAEEIKIVKGLDKNRPILTTDGGEFGLWYKAAREGDIFGTTMYRKVYSNNLNKLFGIGVFEYPLNPAYFHFKRKLTRFIIKDYNKPFLVSELQAEPWATVDFRGLSVEEQFKIFGPEYFRKTIEYAQKTGFNEYYLWGAEWWYWLKEKQNEPVMWEEAKKLFSI